MALDRDTTRIGFIGLGLMGRWMADHIRAAGYAMNVFNRSKYKADPLVEQGAVWHKTPASLAKESDAIFTIIGFPRDVEEIYLGPSGLIELSRPGTYLVDMTTSEPDLAVRIFDAAKAKGLHALDAPVSGGVKGAREAQLTIMVGGEEADFEAVVPVLELMGASVVYQGKAGSGQHTKACNQIINANTIMGISEALAYAHRAGLDIDAVLRSVGKGSAASFHLSNTAPKMAAGDFRPGFKLEHMIKDLEIAVRGAETFKLVLQGTEVALRNYRQLDSEGGAEDGIQALYKVYRDG